MAKLLNLQEWADLTYSKPPSLSTLRRWAREGVFTPPPNCTVGNIRLSLAPRMWIRAKRTCVKT